MSASGEAENAGEPGSVVKMEGGTIVPSSASEAHPPDVERQSPAGETASEIREPRAEYLTDHQPGSTARDEIGTSDLRVATEASIDRIDGHLRTLQKGLSRIESKFETLVS